MSPTSPRKIVITGATGALGQCVLARFRGAGDAVIALHAPTQKPAAIDGVEWVAVDVTQRKAVHDFFSKAGDFDAVVHCAGGFRWGHIEDIGPEDFRFLLALNLESSFYVASAVVPAMKKKKNGVLLFISSRATMHPATGMSAYAASKAGVNALVTTLAEELKGDGVRVNAVLPSVIDTPANRKDMPHADMTKWVSPEDLAEVLYDLTLSKSKSITGALIPVYGRI
jgi:NAD(P)-dependent dehydrogenase (short-subunit alcohol dehydrogenase family)